MVLAQDDSITTPAPHQRSKPLKLPTIPLMNRQAQVPPLQSGPGSRGYGNKRRRFHRGVTSIRSFFRGRTTEGDGDDSQPHSQTLPPSMDGSHTAIAYSPIDSQQSATRLQLSGLTGEKLQREGQDNTSERIAQHEHSRKSSPVSITSAQSIRRRISQRFRDTLSPSSPTVIVKPKLRARPSVQLMSVDHSSAISSSSSSNSQGSTSTMQKHTSSTPFTSDGTLSGHSPRSITRVELDLAPASDQLLILSGMNETTRKLSTIQEVDKQYLATIKTIEATAAAK